MNLPDGGIENNEANRLLLIQTIRKYQPEIIVCNAIHDRHPDHAIAAKLVADAAFLSGLKKKETFTLLVCLLIFIWKNYMLLYLIIPLCLKKRS